MDTSSHADIQTNRRHSCKKKKEEGKRDKERKNTCRDENMSRTISTLLRPENSQTQILELKRTTSLSKQSPPCKSKTKLPWS